MRPSRSPLLPLASLTAAACVLTLSCATRPSKAERLATRIGMDSDYERRLGEWPVAYEVRYLATRYGPTHAILSGPRDAPVLVLLHAMGTNALTYAPNVAALTAGYRVAAIDTIGDQGMSIVRRDYPETGKEYADWVADVVSALGTHTVGLVGCSMGGWIALCTAAYRPEVVERLVLISPAAGIPARTTWGPMLVSIVFNPNRKNLLRFGARLLGSGPAYRDWIDYFLAASQDSKGAKLGMPADLPDADLIGISVPVLLLVGEHEVVYADRDRMESSARCLLARVEIRSIPQAWHLGHYDNPQFVNDAIERFLGAPSGG